MSLYVWIRVEVRVPVVNLEKGCTSPNPFEIMDINICKSYFFANWTQRNVHGNSETQSSDQTWLEIEVDFISQNDSDKLGDHLSKPVKSFALFFLVQPKKAQISLKEGQGAYVLEIEVKHEQDLIFEK